MSNFTWLPCVYIIVLYIFVQTTSSTSSDKVDMITLAKNISLTINNPSGESLDFIENIQIYYERLEKVFDEIKNNDTTNWLEFFKIKENGGPEHIKLYPVSPASLATYYKWDHFTVWQFRGLMKYTWVLWQDLMDYVKEQSNDL